MQNPNPINIRAIDHVVLRVTDLESMVRFYTDVLGCRLERGPGDLGLAQMRAGASLIDLIDSSGPLGKQAGAPLNHGAPLNQGAPLNHGAPPDHGAQNMDHFCLQVEPWDNDAIRGHLEACGIELSGTASRYGALGQGPSIYLQDPEGNTVELKGR